MRIACFFLGANLGGFVAEDLLLFCDFVWNGDGFGN